MNSRPAQFAAAAILVLGVAPASGSAQSGDAYIEGVFVDPSGMAPRSDHPDGSL